jgi:tRNA(Ile)-lysidine synthase TilS/MesJ
MSVFHNSQLFTMKASYVVRDGDLRVIRPLVYVRETETRKFAESNNLPVIPENCPACFSEPKERNRMKQLLAQQEILHPHLFHSLKKAMKPLLGLKVDSYFKKESEGVDPTMNDDGDTKAEAEKLNKLAA